MLSGVPPRELIGEGRALQVPWLGLVQFATKKWLEAYKKSEKFKAQFINRMAKAFPTGRFENWGICQSLFPHTQKAIDYRPDDEESQKEWAFLLYKGGWYALEQGKYTTSETMAEMSRDIRETLLGPDHPDTLASTRDLASIYRNQGRWKEAESLEVQVMETRKTVLGPDHPHTLNSMNNLAFTWKSQGRTADAIRLLEDCIQSRIRVLGPDHPHTLSSLSALKSWHRELSSSGNDSVE
ncbi:hypothetical protein F5Y16DRAFT_254185 [Xylariaceae sp. FL0255]|nr:hypothetical protein F5Y16DRAFT_254185 [Xylariaceae sp. FL0255]